MNTEDVHTVLEAARRVAPVSELTFRIAAIVGVAPTGRLHDLGQLDDALETELRAAHAEEAVADRPALADELERGTTGQSWSS